MNHRLIRVCELLKRELGLIIGRDLRFRAALVSVRAVDITPNLKRAHVFISALGTAPQKKEALLLLEKNRPMIQKELSRRVVLKYTPTLVFELDESIERGTRVIALIDEILPLDSRETEDESSTPLVSCPSSVSANLAAGVIIDQMGAGEKD